MSDHASSGDDGVSGTFSAPFLTAAILIAALVMMGILSYPLINGQIFLEDDIASVYIPFRHFFAESLKNGDDFIWIPNVYNGFYLQGESQTGMTHPLHIALYKYLPFTQAFDLELLISYPFMFLGTILFLRRWKLPLHAVLFGALLCTFSGYPTSRWLYIVHIGALAHAPWLLYCIDVVMRSKRPGKITLASFGVALLTASALLVGYPHIVFIFGLVEGLYALFLLPQVPRLWTLPLLLWAKILAVCCAAIQLLPTYDLAMHSMRTAFDYESRMWGSQHPANLLQLVNPYFAQQRTFRYVGYDTFYGGAVITLLVVWLLLRYRRLSVPRPMVVCFGIAAALGAILSLGHYGYLYRGVSLLPVFNMFRGAARHGAMFHLGWVFLATLAYVELHRIRERGEKAPWRELWPLAALPIVSIGVVAAVALAHRYADTSALAESLHGEFTPTANAAVGAAIMIGATGLFAAACRGWRFGLLALLIFTFVDLGVYGLRHKTVGDYGEFIAGIEVPPGPPDFGYEPNYLPTSNVMAPLMFGYRTAEGRASIEPRRHLDYYLNETPLRASGVKWVRVRVGANEELNRYAEAGIEWMELDDPMPRARLVTRIQVSDDPAADIESIELATTALVEKPLAIDVGEPGTVEVIEDRPGEIHLRVNAPTSQLLVLTESYYPGWRVRVDGKSVETLRVNGDFLGCVVSAGEHSVDLIFDPDSWRYGKAITAAALLLTILFHVGLFGRLHKSASTKLD